jgi:acyl dehydratase
MYFDDLKIGMTMETAPAVIEKEKMLAFARDYDPIPLHTDEEYAKKTKFGKLIAPGVMSFMSVWAKYLENDFFGEELVAGLSTKMEWLKPVYADDVLVGKVTIIDLVKRNPRNGLVTVSVDIYNQNGELVLKDVTESVVRCRPE